MTYNQIIKAYPALQELGKTRLPFAESRKIYTLTKAVKSECDFYASEEWKLVGQYAKCDANGQPILQSNGGLSFACGQNAVDYINAVAALKEMECEVKPIEIPESAFESIQITPENLEALDGFIIFTTERKE